MLFFLKDVFPILLYDFVKPIKNGKFAKYDNLGKLRHGRLASALAMKQNGNEKSEKILTKIQVNVRIQFFGTDNQIV